MFLIILDKYKYFVSNFLFCLKVFFICFFSKNGTYNFIILSKSFKDYLMKMFFLEE